MNNREKHKAILNMLRENIEEYFWCDQIKPLSSNPETMSMYIFDKDPNKDERSLTFIVVGSMDDEICMEIMDGGPSLILDSNKNVDLLSINTAIEWLKRKYL